MTTVVKKFVSAKELADNDMLASAYLSKRQLDLEKFMQSLKWESRDGFILQADIYGNKVLHELQECRLHAFPVWGELFWAEPGTSGKEDPVIFRTFENFAAYVLAKWW